jgi:lysyl oxidase
MNRALPAFAAFALLACSNDEPISPAPVPPSPTTPTTPTNEPVPKPQHEPPPHPGALVRVTMSGEVGVLLDELPDWLREMSAQQLVLEPESFWLARARRQVGRSYVYQYYDSNIPSIEPPETWKIELTDEPARATFQGHDVVRVGWTFEAMLVTDLESPTKVGTLEEIGGVYDRDIILPLDPDLLYQRIAEDCNDIYPYCSDAVTAHIGRVDASFHFERLAWNPTVAEAARLYPVKQPGGADLEVLVEGLEHHLVNYRYFEPDSCAIAEGCVGGPGWRRLVEFDASVANRGSLPMHIGDVPGAWNEHNTFEFSPCHQHFHFLHYGQYDLGTFAGDKRAFCLISTSRYGNNEYTPLVTPYNAYCQYQGIAAGWGDDYGIGLDCQWIDVTSLDTSSGPVTLPLAFTSNPDGFLCEGTPVLGDDGQPIFEATGLTTPAGDPVDRPKCSQFDAWNANNSKEVDVTVPTRGNFMTQPCTIPFLSPRRDCGLVEQAQPPSCTPGQQVQLSCSGGTPGAPQHVRVCSRSEALDASIPCGYLGARARADVTGDPVTLTFNCPQPLGAGEPGGTYSVFAMPFVSAGTAMPVTCTPL